MYFEITYKGPFIYILNKFCILDLPHTTSGASNLPLLRYGSITKNKTE